MIRTRKVISGAAAACLLTTLLTVVNAPAANAHGVPVPGNMNCSELVPGAPELRVENPTSGTFTDGILTVNLSVYTLASDDPAHPGNQTGSPVFDFTASGAVVIGVAVKGGPDTNFFDYRPGGTAGDDGLHAPVNPNNQKFFGLSHVSFCYARKAKPNIETRVASPEITIGGSVTDLAILSGGNNPTGSITFRVYGPGDVTCSGAPVFTSTVAVNGNGTYESGVFTPEAVGTYRWIASYSGDFRNNAAAGACGDPDEGVVVRKARPRLRTAPYVLPNDTATLNGLVDPAGGTIVFSLFFNADCSGAPEYTEPARTVNANGAFHTSNTTVRVSEDATISWIVEYSGDAKNEPAVSACTDEQVVLDFTPLGS
jgi:hypothetical protein